MGFIVRELHLALFIFCRKLWVFITPLAFLIFCLILKQMLIQRTEVDTSVASIDFIGPIVDVVKEKALRKMDKITI